MEAHQNVSREIVGLNPSSGTHLFPTSDISDYDFDHSMQNELLIEDKFMV